MKALVFSPVLLARLDAIRVSSKGDENMQNTTMLFSGKIPTFLVKSKLSTCERKRLNCGSFSVMVNALLRFKVMVESVNISDRFPKTRHLHRQIFLCLRNSEIKYAH